MDSERTMKLSRIWLQWFSYLLCLFELTDVQ